MALSFSVFLFALLKLYFSDPYVSGILSTSNSGVPELAWLLQCYFCLVGHRRELPWFRPSDSVEVYLRIYQ